MMTDFHTHVLPNIDDGSKNPEESVQMLTELSLQDIDKVIATPHFYPQMEKDVDSFLEKRNEAQKILNDYILESGYGFIGDSQSGSETSSDDVVFLPSIKAGAEVAFFENISVLDNIEKLAIEGTNILLVEMPMHSFSKREIDSLFNLQQKKNVKIMIAHIDRWIGYKGNEDSAREMRSGGIILQMNADYIINASSKRKAMKYIRAGMVNVLGSDCHNMMNRKPEIGQAISAISRKLGNDTIEQIKNFGEALLEESAI